MVVGFGKKRGPNSSEKIGLPNNRNLASFVSLMVFELGLELLIVSKHDTSSSFPQLANKLLLEILGGGEGCSSCCLNPKGSTDACNLLTRSSDDGNPN
ncbi:hypothetical protein Leryth_009827 [Lithospermum erythrorhizon]|nr:hypothetical protein Leryth_009827 [Lithospermum erythrorhizon]